MVARGSPPFAARCNTSRARTCLAKNELRSCRLWLLRGATFLSGEPGPDSGSFIGMVTGRGDGSRARELGHDEKGYYCSDNNGEREADKSACAPRTRSSAA